MSKKYKKKKAFKVVRTPLEKLAEELSEDISADGAAVGERGGERGFNCIKSCSRAGRLFDFA